MTPWWILVAALCLPLFAALYHVIAHRAKMKQRPPRDVTKTPTALMTRPGWHQALARQQGSATEAPQTVPGSAHDETPADLPR